MKLAVVGATGLVGREMIRILEERDISIDVFMPVASERSAGKTVTFRGEEHRVIGMQAALDQSPDIALFSAGAATSADWAPEFSKRGTRVIDNSSAWRQHDHIPLVVPEINAEVIGKEDMIIANPNCSTIQLVMALAPLHSIYKIRRVVVSTYQSVSGSGLKGIRQLEDEREGKDDGERIYPHKIDMNVIPEAGNFESETETSEELKLARETKKIIGDQSIRVTATAVRVPVTGGHSEAVNIEFENAFTEQEVFSILNEFPGVTVMDVPSKHFYPTPVIAKGSDEVFVGRIRRDTTVEHGLNLWIVSDNLRKGAATNAVQIAQHLIAKGFVKQ